MPTNAKLEQELDELLFTQSKGRNKQYRHRNYNVKLPKHLRQYILENYNITKTTFIRNELDEAIEGMEVPVHDMCVSCQYEQIKKYDGFLYDEGHKLNNEFVSSCNFFPAGVPKQLVDKLKGQMEDLTDEQITKFVHSTIDPVAWCELVFGFNDDDPDWHLRPYQKEMLRCTSKWRVIRAGRRVGKTFTQVLRHLFLLFTKKFKMGSQEGIDQYIGPNIAVITPFKAQVSEFFAAAEALIERAPFLKNELKIGQNGNIYRKTPFFMMEHKNGGRLNGFVTGVNDKDDGSAGGQLRGQNPVWIYCDETDMIPEAVIDSAILPLMLTHRRTMMTFTSTPIGKRGAFYKAALEDPQYKETYLPSMVIPHWETVRRQAEKKSDEAFSREYVAEFIDGTYSVFKPSKVYASRRDYSYADADPESTFWTQGLPDSAVESPRFRPGLKPQVFMGIDWNSGNTGTEIFVLLYNPNTGLFWAADVMTINANEFESQRFKEEVLRMNHKWRPDFIYADKGYGHHLIEELHIIGMRAAAKREKTDFEEATARLPDILKAFTFQSKIKLYQPDTGQEVEQYAKDYLVQNARRIVESNRLRIPLEETLLIDQMLNYVVKKISESTGRPIYSADNKELGDHRLDAFMIALAAWGIEVGQFSMQTPDDPSVSITTEHPMSPHRAKYRGQNPDSQSDDLFFNGGEKSLKIVRSERARNRDRAQQEVDSLEGNMRFQNDFGAAMGELHQFWEKAQYNKQNKGYATDEEVFAHLQKLRNDVNFAQNSKRGSKRVRRGRL